jgi:rod shape determining protein RodA
MYSAGFDHGTRFVDHGRNMLIALAVLFVVAQVPPQKLSAGRAAVRALGVVLLVAVACSASRRRAPRAGSTWAW